MSDLLDALKIVQGQDVPNTYRNANPLFVYIPSSGRMYELMHGWMDGCMDGWMDGWADRETKKFDVILTVHRR